MEISPTNYFYCNDGSVFKSVDEFMSALKTMGEQTFHHHVSPQRNDFAIWIRHVFHEEQLADALERAKERAGMLTELDKFFHPTASTRIERELPIEEKLKLRLIELRKKISEKRKHGGYTKIAELKLMNVPSKIKLFKATQDNNEIAKIETVFNEVEEDLKTEYP